MPRKRAVRKPPTRKRDYKAEIARRNARARERGYGSYYEERIARAGNVDRTTARGHRNDSVRTRFLRELDEGDIINLPAGLSSVEKVAGGRWKGRYREMTKLVIDAETSEEREYTFRNFTRRWLVNLIKAEEKTGAIWTPGGYDQRRLVTDREADGGY